MNSLASSQKTNHVPGYHAVLVRADVKAQLTSFRRDSGLRDNHIERCLVTAGLQLLLTSESLKEQWLEKLKETLQSDLSLMFKQESA